MAIQNYKKNWSFKPPLGALLDPTHSLTNGLKGCWIFNEGGGSTINDLVTRRQGVLTSGTGANVWSNQQVGPSVNSVNTNNYWVSPTSNLVFPMSVVLIFRPNVLASTVSGLWSYNNGTNKGWAIRLSAASPTAVVYQDDSLIRGFSLSIPTADAGKYFLLAMTIASAGSTPVGYLGKLGGTLAQANGSGSGAATLTGANQFWIGKITLGTATTYDLNYSQVMVYNRVLSRNDILTLYRDQYCFLRPPAPRLRQLEGAPGLVPPKGFYPSYPNIYIQPNEVVSL